MDGGRRSRRRGRTEPADGGRRSRAGRVVTMGRGRQLGWWCLLIPAGGGGGGLAAGGGSGPVGVRARAGGDGQRGAQRPGALRPDPGGGGAHDPGGARGRGAAAGHGGAAAPARGHAGSHPGRAAGHRGLPGPAGDAAADRHRAGPGLDPVGIRGRHRYHAGYRPGPPAQHGVHQLARARAGREPVPSAGRGPGRAAAGLVRQRPRHQGEVPRIGSRWAGTSARCPASTRSSSTRP